MPQDNHIFLKNGSRMFFGKGLDEILINRSVLPAGQDQLTRLHQTIAGFGNSSSTVKPTINNRTRDARTGSLVHPSVL